MAENKAKKTSSDDTKAKVFDVAKPSEVAAEPTSRPIIVGHGKSLQRDPMMAADENTEAEVNEVPEETKLEKPKRELKLEPDAQDQEAEATEPAPEEAPKEEEKTAIDDQLPSDSAAVDALADTVSIKREEEAALEAEAKKLEEIEKVIASKQYFVKVKTPPGKRNMQWLALLVLLVAAGAAWYMLMGPGKDLWAKEEPASAASIQSASTQTTTQATLQTQDKPQIAEYKNTAQGISFKYPTKWKTETSKLNEKSGVEKIVLTSDEQRIRVPSGSGSSDIGAYLRVTILSMPDRYISEYDVLALGLKLCKPTADKFTSNKDLNLVLISEKSASNPQLGMLTSETCSKSKPVSLKGHFQLNAQSSKYFALAVEYIPSDEYLKKTGIIDDKEISLSQKAGLEVMADSFQGTVAFVDVITTIQSLKEVQ